MDDQLKQIIENRVQDREAQLILAITLLQVVDRLKRLEKLVYGAAGLILSTVILAIVGLVLVR